MFLDNISTLIKDTIFISPFLYHFLSSTEVLTEFQKNVRVPQIAWLSLQQQ